MYYVYSKLMAPIGTRTQNCFSRVRRSAGLSIPGPAGTLIICRTVYLFVHCAHYIALSMHGVSWTLILGGGAKQGRSQNFGSGGTSNKISYINFSHVLYCNGVAKISVLRKHLAKMYSSKTFEKFQNIYKMHKNSKNCPKIFKNKI